MHRIYVCMKNPVMRMHQIEIHAADFPLHEPGKNQWAQEAWESDDRDFVELDSL